NSLTSSIRRHLQHLEQSLSLYQRLQRAPADPEIQEAVRVVLRAGEDTASSETLLQRFARYLQQHDIDMGNLEERLHDIQSTLNKTDGIRSFFLNVKGPELLDKYVGETEHRTFDYYRREQPPGYD